MDDKLKKIEMQWILDTMKDQLPEVKQYQRISAELMHTFYQSLLDQGFDKEEALRIILAHGAFPSMGGVK